jgi:putative transcriptional regulator
MKEELFADLISSVREAGAIRRGERPASRVIHLDAPDIKGIRTAHKLTQAQFAAMIGVSVRTLQEWEQGRRTPEGPAMVLLRVVRDHPEAVIDTVSVVG